VQQQERPVAKRILVVEDDLDIRASLVEVLGFMGNEAMIAGDGREALQLLQENELPSLILLDLSMPGMDGSTFRTKQLADARLARVPVVLISADAELREKARALKVAAFVRKPIDVDLLTAAVERLPDRRKTPSLRMGAAERRAHP
jgi:CheY-like chemotaxis protein